jgi:Cu(I)/Ag(I) efflux system membrane protein CusA/SilA
MLISLMLPMAVLMTFIGMKVFGVDANIVALSGIAIAVGTIVDMGIVLSENILRRLNEAGEEESTLEVVYQASSEVGSAVLTAVLTTVVSFLPVFTMTGAEGKLFKPLAYTKTFALIASIIIALTILPPLAHALFAARIPWRSIRRTFWALVALGGVAMAIWLSLVGGLLLIAFGVFWFVRPWLPPTIARIAHLSANVVAVLVVLVILTSEWEPLGPEPGFWRNAILVGGLIGGLIGVFYLFQLVYPWLLSRALRNKLAALAPPFVLVVLGLTIWLGFDRTFGWLPESVRKNETVVDVAHEFPGLGKEFMPSLDEGSFLYMPTTMPHASIGEALDVLQKLDMVIASVPEVDEVVGKIGRVDSPLDPAPVSMVETVITYHSEYITDESGDRLRFRVDESDQFVRDKNGQLIRDPDGLPFRQWRDQINAPQDIWDAIVDAADLPGTTSAPKLQPIETRIVMLQSGMRAPMGLKVYGPDLETIESFALELERLLKQVPQIQPAAVQADRVVGKPYLEIDIDRERIARYGIRIRDVQDVIEVAIGGRPLTRTVEGRERYPVRVRYMRELRDRIETLGDILVPAPDGTQVPLDELATIEYRRGPQMIKSENTFLTAYVIFDKRPEYAEVEVVEAARRFLESKIDAGELTVPRGVSYEFAGSFENQVRAQRTLMIVVPLALAIIFLILYFQFRSVSTTLIVFCGVFVAWSGGFLLIWCYGQPWFLDFSVFDTNMRDLFQIHPINLSVAVWVGFLALFGIATDDGVVMATRLKQVFGEQRPDSIDAIRAATVDAGRLRIRACLMTTATTILALLPVLTARGRGADIMVPMAIPSFGGMLVELFTLFVVPVLFCAFQEWRLRLAAVVSSQTAHSSEHPAPSTS